jgi:hypothetical protein
MSTKALRAAAQYGHAAVTKQLKLAVTLTFKGSMGAQYRFTELAISSILFVMAAL